MLISNRFPYLEIEICIGTWSFIEEAYLDTGFDGGLIIPKYLRWEILAEPGRESLRVADDALIRTECWSGSVVIDDREFRCEISALGSRFLLGRDIMDQLDMRLEFGRRVTVRFKD